MHNSKVFFFFFFFQISHLWGSISVAHLVDSWLFRQYAAQYILDITVQRERAEVNVPIFNCLQWYMWLL